MYIYIRPSDYVIFVKKYKQFINKHSKDNLTKEQIKKFKDNLAFQQCVQTSLIAVKNDYITMLTISNPTGNINKDLNNVRDLIKRNHYEIIDEHGNKYSWPEFLKLF